MFRNNVGNGVPRLLQVPTGRNEICQKIVEHLAISAKRQPQALQTSDPTDCTQYLTSNDTEDLNSGAQHLRDHYLPTSVDNGAPDLDKALGYRKRSPEALTSPAARNEAECSPDADTLLNLQWLQDLLIARYQIQARGCDIDWIIMLGEQILEWTSPRTLNAFNQAFRIAEWRGKRALLQNDKADVTRALDLLEEIVDRFDQSHPAYPWFLLYLGYIHTEHFPREIEDRLSHLRESLRHYEDVDQSLKQHEERKPLIDTLTGTYTLFYLEWNDKYALNKSLTYPRDAIGMPQRDTAQRILSLRLLSFSLRLKYHEKDATEDLRKSTEHALTALRLGRRENLPEYERAVLRELCDAHQSLWRTTHNLGDIEATIDYCKQALELPANPADPDNYRDFARLSEAYIVRYESKGQGGIADLDKSIQLLYVAVKSTSYFQVHVDMINLAARLLLRSENIPNAQDMKEALSLCHSALSLISRDHAHYPRALLAQCGIEFQLYKENPSPAALDKCFNNAMKTLNLSAIDPLMKSHIFRFLSKIEYSRYRSSGKEEDLTRSRVYASQSVDVCPEKSYMRPFCLVRVIGLLFEGQFKFQTPVGKRLKVYVSQLLSNPRSTPYHQFDALKVCGMVGIFNKDWATAFDSLSAAIRLFPKISLRVLNRDEQHQILAGFSGLAALAASSALNAHKSHSEALEILEAGRGITSGWMINGRNDISRLRKHDEKLAEKYIQLRDAITIGSTVENDGSAQWNMVSLAFSTEDQRRKDIYELEKIEQQVRDTIPGLGDFQQALSAEDMIQLAAEAKVPIVEINAHGLRSDAFIISSTGLLVLELPWETAVHIEAILKLLYPEERHTLSAPSMQYKTNVKLEAELNWLYQNVVIKIMDKLKLPASAGKASQRLIWVTNGLVGLCPFHAAGSTKPKSTANTLSHVVSSYIPSLKALKHTRERKFSLKLKDMEVLVVAMSKTTNERDLAAEEEARNIEACFGPPLTKTVKVLRRPSKDEVIRALKRCSVAHFACHGQASLMDPWSSCLLLKDSIEPGKPDRLSVRDIESAKHNSAQLAYLSACSTANITLKIPMSDECIHIASIFQLSGFSHVVGTMWEARDRFAVAISQVFYKELAEGIRRLEQRYGQGGRDGDGPGPGSGPVSGDDCIAYALHEAVRVVRDTKKQHARWNPQLDILTWAPFIHLGP
jgi:hypothetical protein